MNQSHSPAPLRAPGRLTTEVVRDHERLAALADEWGRLYAACSTATPFQTHAWLTSWWRHYGASGDLRVVLVRDGEALLAAAPLFASRRGPFSVLVPVGEGISDYTDVLVADGTDSVAAREALVRALLDEPGWQVLDLPEVRPGGAAERLAGDWSGPTTTLAASTSLELPGVPLAQALDRLRKDSAKAVQRKLRKADQLGVTVAEVDADVAEDAVDRLLALHARQWDGRGMTPEHGRERFADHLREALPRMVREGSAALTEYRVGEEVVVCEALILSKGLLGAYLAGMAPEIRQAIDVAVRTTRHNMDLAAARGIGAFSMLRGEEPYKQRLHPDAVVSSRLLLVHPDRRSGTLYVRLVRGRADVVRLAKQRAPWLRAVHARLTSLGGRRAR